MSETENDAPTPFSDQELQVFQTLRTRYEEDHDCFTRRERAQLQFLRWLHEEGYLDSPPGNNDTRPGGKMHWMENSPEADRDVA